MSLLEMPTKEISKTKTADLRSMLRDCLQYAVDGLKRAAEIVCELDSREEDAGIDEQSLAYLRRIGGGQLLPDLLLNWRDTAVFSRASKLPLTAQKAVVSNEPIRVVCIKDGGKVDAWLCEPRNMTTAVAKQVFAPDHIRTESEQIAWLRGTQAQAVQDATEKKPAVVPYVIRGNKVEFVEPCILSKRQLQALLKAMS